MAGKPKIHAAAELFPMLSEWELKELAADIQLNGLQVPLVRTKDGQLLDGRNRWLACEAAGVQPRWETYEGDPFRYVVSANLHRRHLSDKQRAMIAAKLANLGIGANQWSEDDTVKQDEWLLSYIDSHGGAAKAVDIYADGEKAGHDRDALKRSRKRLRLTWTGGGNDWTWTRGVDTPDDVPPPRETPLPPTHAEAADLLNVSRTSVDRSRMVIHHGTDELRRAVEDDVLPLTSAARTAMAFPPEQQNEVVRRVRNGENWRNVVPSTQDAPDRSDIRLQGLVVTPVRQPPGGVRSSIDEAMTLRLVSGLDGYEVGLSSVTQVADDVTPEVATNALRVIERFGKTLRKLQRLLREVRDEQE